MTLSPPIGMQMRVDDRRSVFEREKVLELVRDRLTVSLLAAGRAQGLPIDSDSIRFKEEQRVLDGVLPFTYITGYWCPDPVTAGIELLGGAEDGAVVRTEIDDDDEGLPSLDLALSAPVPIGQILDGHPPMHHYVRVGINPRTSRWVYRYSEQLVE